MAYDFTDTLAQSRSFSTATYIARILAEHPELSGDFNKKLADPASSKKDAEYMLQTLESILLKASREATKDSHNEF